MKKKTTIRTPKQKRSIEKKEKILKAGMKLFSKEGYHNIHSNAIAREAGVAVGTFYAYFQDKKDVLLELIKQYQENFFHDIFENVIRNETPEIDKMIQAMITGAFRAFDINPDFHRIMYVMQFTDDDVKKIFLEAEKKEIDLICTFMEKRMGHSKGKNLRLQATIIHHAVTGVAHKIKLIHPAISDKEAIESVSRMVLNFLEK